MSHTARFLSSVLLGSLLIPCLPHLSAQCEWVERQEVSGNIADQRFGGATAIDTDVAIVGSFLDNSASVYRLEGSEWVHEQELMPATVAPLFLSPFFVDVSGDVAIIGAQSDNENDGAAFVYRFDGTRWNEEQKLTASDVVGDGFLGFSVSVDGDVTLIGSLLSGDASGAAYVYRYDGSSWLEEQKLMGDATVTLFGYSTCIRDHRAVVGVGQGNAAFVYEYDGSQWLQQQKLVPSDGGDKAFGVSVAMSGSKILIGAPGDDELERSGAVYAYRLESGNWLEEQKLHANDFSFFLGFGTVLDLDQDIAVVGTALPKAYVENFADFQWTEGQQLVAGDGPSGDAFASALAVSGNVALIGASSHDDVAPNAGAAYFFSTTDFNVDAQPDTVAEGELLTLTAAEGLANTNLALVVVDVSGVSTFITLAIGTFGIDGEWVFAATVPPGLQGNTMTMQAFGFDACDSFRATSPKLVTFQ